MRRCTSRREMAVKAARIRTGENASPAPARYHRNDRNLHLAIKQWLKAAAAQKRNIGA